MVDIHFKCEMELSGGITGLLIHQAHHNTDLFKDCLFNKISLIMVPILDKFSLWLIPIPHHKHNIIYRWFYDKKLWIDYYCTKAIKIKRLMIFKAFVSNITLLVHPPELRVSS